MKYKVSIKFILFIIVSFSRFYSIGQEHLLSYNQNTDLKSGFLNANLSNHIALNKEIKKIKPKEVSQKMLETVKSVRSYFLKGAEDNDYIFDKALYQFLDSIMITIIKANQLNFTTRPIVVVSKDVTVNAFSFIDGTILIHLGLLANLENEDQLASVLAHELAHLYLNHQINDLYTITMEELRDEKSGMKNANLHYLSTEKPLTLLKSRLYQNARNQRANEFSADSLAVHFISKTAYQTKEYAKFIRNEIKYDTVGLPILKPDILKNWFDLPKQPFKDIWLESKSKDYVYHEGAAMLNVDSLNTHPLLNERLTNLENLNIPNEHGKTSISDNSQFEYWSEKAAKEYFASFIHFEKTGLGLYFCLFALSEYPESKELRFWLHKLLNSACEARKKYVFNRHFESATSRDLPLEEYRIFLRLMWNLSTSELSVLAEHYK
jgi:hypothetical protein